MSAFPAAGPRSSAQPPSACGEAPGYQLDGPGAAASVLALARPGLKPADVDGLFVGLPDDSLSGLTLRRISRHPPEMTDNNRTGGSAFQIHVALAALALDAGLCDVALIAYGSNQRSGAGKLVTLRPAARL